MIDLLRLCRLYYSIPMSLAYALTVYYTLAGAVTGHWPGIIFSTAALALVISAAYVINDVHDRHIDRINSPMRPIAAGRIKPKIAVIWGALLLLTGMVLAALCRWQYLVALSLVAVGLIFYDLFSKRLGIGKQLLVAVLMTSIYPLAFAQAGELSGSRAMTLTIFPIWLFLTSFGYEGLKDIRDIPGDKAMAAELTWIQRHPRLGRNLSMTAIVAGATVLIGPYLLGCGWVYMVIVSLAILVAVMAAFQCTQRALMFVYLECVVVGIAATADVVVLGM